jgi:hypothetical protein
LPFLDFRVENGKLARDFAPQKRDRSLKHACSAYAHTPPQASLSLDGETVPTQVRPGVITAVPDSFAADCGRDKHRPTGSVLISQPLRVHSWADPWAGPKAPHLRRPGHGLNLVAT